ncbi:aminoglycoside phosphotransferase [Streptomonospora alba]|uniref:Aminoglycoside phosphotransferase n=2 Tax=Streptomonospora alba TaxID=183763 RepID=A0A0C2G2Z9_9ACTN|nr:aminoglycoside phosphotransferase [Streptomonospora alba]
MEFRAIERDSSGFQRPVTADDVHHIVHRAFGPDVRANAAVELGGGMYNTTYRLETDGTAPVILRVAPEPARQNRSERRLMRNEYASLPFLAPIAHLMPQVVAADFTHELVARDYLLQTVVPGVPAPEHLGTYPREQWSALFAQMGEIARRIHDVCGAHFGPVGGPGFANWSEAFLAALEDAAADIDDAGLDSADLRRVIAVTDKHRAVLDEVTQPRLLHGDLWTVNVMLDPDAAEPQITGVFDCDRTLWGDPAADWTIYMATRRRGGEREAFWQTYGQLPDTPASRWRQLVYTARHISAIRLERHRTGHGDVDQTYALMRQIADDLG